MPEARYAGLSAFQAAPPAPETGRCPSVAVSAGRFRPTQAGKGLTEGIDLGGFTMTLGTSLFLIAVGAVLRFAVNVSTSGFNIHTVGVILMIVGAVGFIISLLWMTMWADRRNRPVREHVVYDDRDYPPARGV
jgi:Domain of unknown function (DUF6458)